MSQPQALLYLILPWEADSSWGNWRRSRDPCQSPDCGQFPRPFVRRASALKLGHEERALSSNKALWVSSPPDYSLQAESGGRGSV